MSNSVKARKDRRRFKCPKCKGKRYNSATTVMGDTIYICQSCGKSYRVKKEQDDQEPNLSSAAPKLRFPDLM